MFVCIRRAAIAATGAAFMLSLVTVASAAPQDKLKKKDPTAEARKPAAEKASQVRKRSVDRSRISVGTRADKAAQRGRSGTVKKATLAPEVGAKYVCDKTEVELEPIWRKSGTLTWDFYIKSAGTKPLKIKAKGG